MSSQVFSDGFREAIWLAFDQKCFYDGRPLLFNLMHIDHLIPEYLLKNPSEYAEVLASLGLEEFDINSSLNLVPACQTCNSGKGGMNVAANQMILYLNQVREKQQRLNKILGDKKAAKSVDQIIRDIDRSVGSGKFAVDQLVGGLSVKFNDYGYMIEKVELPPVVAPAVGEVFKPLIFLGNTASAIKELSVRAHKILCRLHSLQRGDMEGVRPLSQSEASALRVGDVKVLFREHAGKIYVLLIKHKSKHW
ncbi:MULTISPECIES: HNH endonuclease [Pseudomonas chlororaphis group]|uniref:HNH endonuclease n=1 Tax=Pseudomonas chlororaphis group TaxID=136842 RepID=UPI0020981755|nr:MULTISPECIES: HNH endonuclease [Pseudomonas chlororaphis group]MCO7580246.1 HNH endonuclease [Pseudomonas protegens]MCO7586287.1 HNH endonuclease [Pseudomonas chlororaphis]MCO7603403.1 HNH endonuclease [Pseudomonas chlororaphis]